MDIKLAKNFYYRLNETDAKTLFSKFNTDKHNITRNNSRAIFHKGEWIHIKINDYITHIVKPAENLEKIAQKYNIPVEKLKTDNNLNSDSLFIGKILKIYK